MTDYALCPDDGPPRILRFTYDLDEGVMSVLDKPTNVLRINKSAFDRLSEVDKQRIIKTQAVYTFERYVSSDRSTFAE